MQDHFVIKNLRYWPVEYGHVCSIDACCIPLASAFSCGLNSDPLHSLHEPYVIFSFKITASLQFLAF